MKKTLTTTLLLLALSLVIIAACKPATQNPPITGEINLNQDVTITYKTYGGFTMPEYNINILTITKEKAVLEIRGTDNSLTATAEKQLTEEEHFEYIQLLNQNRFMSLQSLYEPKAGDPLVADTGNLEIVVSNANGEIKKVEVIPYSSYYMPQKLQNINDELSELASELYMKATEQTAVTEVSIQFQPMQCETTPWQAWYEEGKILYIKAPTNEELIQDYYANEFGIELKDVNEVETDRMVCEACGVCPISNYFIASVNSDDKTTMLEDGWTEI